MAIDEDLRKILEEFTVNPNNKAEEKQMIDLSNKDKPVVTIFPDDKYLQFHDEYVQIAPDIDELKPLIDYANSKNWDNNLD